MGALSRQNEPRILGLGNSSVCAAGYLYIRGQLVTLQGFPGGSDAKESVCNTGDVGSIPGLGKIPWRRKQLPTPVFWPGEFHGLYSPWGHKESDTTEQLSLS